MRELTHLSLFSGIGGLDIAAEWAGFRTVGQCEWADYPTKVLEKHWPDVPRWRDIRTLTGESFYERTGLRTVDVISGGFPCQPFSAAGKRRGTEDDRFLWPEMVRVIKELRPTWVIGENVAGIVKMALLGILSELEACGYRTRTFLVPACAVGARHRRYRVAIVAHSNCTRLQALWPKQQAAGLTGNGKDVADTESTHERRLPVREKQKKPGFISGGKDVQHPNGAGCQEQHSSRKPNNQGLSCGRCDKGNVCNPAGKGLPDGTGQQMGGYGTSEQESERSGGNVPNHVSRKTFGRNGITKEITKDGRGRSNNSRGTKEYDPGQRRPTQSGLGGVANGISDRLDEALNYLEENAGDFADDDDYLEWQWNDFMIDHYWDAEPDIPRVAAGIPDRVGRLKALGNAVVPQQFYPFFKAIADVMEDMS